MNTNPPYKGKGCGKCMADIVVIGNRIKQAREENGLTQEELGKILGLNKSTVQRYETAKIKKIKLPVIEAMAQILNVNPEWLSDKSNLRTEYNINILPYTPEKMVPVPVDRVKLLREKKGITQAELAAMLGYKSKSSVTHIERGRDIPRSMVVKLADILNTTPAYLMGWDEDKSKSYIPYTPEKMVPVPVVGRVAAGYTCLAETDIQSYELVSPEILNDGYDYVYLKVIGDSMEPLLLEGDMVLVRIQESVDSGDYAVVIVDEEDGVVKQLDFDGNTVKLISQNPYYPPRIFSGKEKKRIRIFGKVIESKRKFF